MACKHCEHHDHHEHEHDHHEHDHHHEHSHKHEHNDSNLEKYLLAVSIILTIAAFLTELFALSPVITAVLSALAIVLSGYEVFIEGVKSIIKLKIDETILMSVAVVAAFALGEFVEGAMVTVLFGIGELLEDFAVEKSRKSIKKLANIQVETATVIVDGKEQIRDAEKVELGDTIVIKPFEKVPLDCVITDGSSFFDASAITGESVPVEKSAGSELLSGMINGERLVTAKVTKSFENSTASRIIKMVEEASAVKSNNEKLITRFASVYTPIVMVIALAIAFIPPIFFGNLTSWIYRGLVCLVASCPCAIVISVPLAYFSGIGAASRAGALIKGGKYLEAIAGCDAVVFDKTGTLTEGKLKVTNIIPYNKYTKEQVLALAASVERHSSHPIAKAIVDEYDGEPIKMENYSERSGDGVSAYLKGHKITCAGGKALNRSDGVYVAVDDNVIGKFELSDTVRPEAKETINGLKKLGVTSRTILTGDSKDNAQKAAKELDITQVYASLLPEDKLKKVQSLKESGKTVCFIGDGINDAPVLAASDCGFAMGLGSDAAIASADAVLSPGNLKPLVPAFKIAKKTVNTSKANIIFSLAVKASVIILAALGFAPIWLGVIADTGVCMLCVINSVRILK